MVLLQPKLNLRVTQKQILTPGLVQMVSVLALNKIELKDMINAEMVENPVLEEMEGSVPLLDDVAAREEDRDRATSPASTEEADPVYGGKEDPFEHVDFGSFFQEYLDPGYRTNNEIESYEKPSFENFLSKPSTLTDHLMWQLGAIHLTEPQRIAAELVIGNLNEDGYLTATEDELMMQARIDYCAPSSAPSAPEPAPAEPEIALDDVELVGDGESAAKAEALLGLVDGDLEVPIESEDSAALIGVAEQIPDLPQPVAVAALPDDDTSPRFYTREDLRKAILVVRQMDPIGVAASDLRGCLLAQLLYHKHIQEETGVNGTTEEILNDSIEIVTNHLRAVQMKQFKEISKATGRSLDAIQVALEYIRTLDPKPGLRYNVVAPRLIEPDVAFIKQGDEYLVILNDEDVPQLRLNSSYKRLL